MVTRSVPDVKNTLFRLDQAGEKVSTAERTRPSDYCLRLSDFSEDEANTAIERYAISSDVAVDIRGHPLLFRIAHDLQLGSLAPSVGRHRLINDFIERHLDEAVTRLGLGSTRTLRAALTRLAGGMPALGGAMSLDEAVRLLGDERRLEILLEVGMLGAAGQRIRFNYDQVAETLRPLPEDPWAPLRDLDPETKLDPAALEDAIAALLRLEDESEETRFAEGFEILMTAVSFVCATSDHEGAPKLGNIVSINGVFEAVMRLARALPRSRESEIERVCEKLADAMPIFAANHLNRLVTAWLGDAPLPLERRVKLLLSVAPWNKAWPWRWRDVANQEDGRQRSVDLVNRDGLGSSAGVELIRLLQSNPAEVRPLLIAHLGDVTSIDRAELDKDRGSATIGSLCAAVLFHDRHRDLAGLTDALIVHGGWAAGQLIREVAVDDPELAADVALIRLADAVCAKAAAFTLWCVARKIPADLTQRVAAALAQTLEGASGEAQLQIALALRKVDPGNEAAWDALAAAAERGEVSGFELSPIPAGRFEAALALARVNAKIGIVMMENHEGPDAEQRRLVDIAFGYLDNPHLQPFPLGALAESRLNRLKKDPRYRSWHDFALKAVDCDSESVLTSLIYCLFGDYRDNGTGFETFPVILDAFLRVPLGSSNIVSIVDLTYKNRIPPSSLPPLLDRLRAINRDLVDREIARHVWLDLGSSIDGEDEYARAVAQTLIGFWDGLREDEQSGKSRFALAAVRSGTPPESIFTEDFVLRS